jgi:hypothetical protein
MIFSHTFHLVLKHQKNDVEALLKNEIEKK